MAAQTCGEAGVGSLAVTAALPFSSPFGGVVYPDGGDLPFPSEVAPPLWQSNRFLMEQSCYWLSSGSGRLALLLTELQSVVGACARILIQGILLALSLAMKIEILNGLMDWIEDLLPSFF
ncbi:hypothetical protein CRG98_008031 [Punica granatum]|uniref:Uncharacterized protein n=1 Tax=Punica granatum TaxID=22663 RepID=A0A2I0KSR2_PUNGR|nr:hypothetical protein CRG98_008031 [Punica granatum]